MCHIIDYMSFISYIIDFMAIDFFHIIDYMDYLNGIIDYIVCIINYMIMYNQLYDFLK